MDSFNPCSICKGNTGCLCTCVKKTTTVYYTYLSNNTIHEKPLFKCVCGNEFFTIKNNAIYCTCGVVYSLEQLKYF